MRNLLLLLFVGFLFAGCSSSDRNQTAQDYIPYILQNHVQNDIDTTGISAEYNKEKECIEMLWKGEIMTVSYNIEISDLSKNNVKSKAKDFLVSMVVLKEDFNKISHLELIVGNGRYPILPFVTETAGDDFIVAGFSSSEESFRVCMELLGRSNSLVEARVYTDKGSFIVPMIDVYELSNMAKGYILDGGEFK